MVSREKSNPRTSDLLSLRETGVHESQRVDFSGQAFDESAYMHHDMANRWRPEAVAALISKPGFPNGVTADFIRNIGNNMNFRCGVLQLARHAVR